MSFLYLRFIGQIFGPVFLSGGPKTGVLRTFSGWLKIELIWQNGRTETAIGVPSKIFGTNFCQVPVVK
jgi:hypothetical protein